MAGIKRIGVYETFQPPTDESEATPHALLKIKTPPKRKAPRRRKEPLGPNGKTDLSVGQSLLLIPLWAFLIVAVAVPAAFTAAVFLLPHSAPPENLVALLIAEVLFLTSAYWILVWYRTLGRRRKGLTLEAYRGSFGSIMEPTQWNCLWTGLVAMLLGVFTATPVFIALPALALSTWLLAISLDILRQRKDQRRAVKMRRHAATEAARAAMRDDEPTTEPEVIDDRPIYKTDLRPDLTFADIKAVPPNHKASPRPAEGRHYGDEPPSWVDALVSNVEASRLGALCLSMVLIGVGFGNLVQSANPSANFGLWFAVAGVVGIILLLGSLGEREVHARMIKAEAALTARRHIFSAEQMEDLRKHANWLKEMEAICGPKNPRRDRGAASIYHAIRRILRGQRDYQKQREFLELLLHEAESASATRGKEY